MIARASLVCAACIPELAAAQCTGFWVNAMASGWQHAYALRPDGQVYIGGQINMGVSRWDGADWHALGTGIDSPGQVSPTVVNALKILANGDLIAAGDFTTAGGLAALNVARWNGTGWSPLGAGLNANVYALAEMPNGDIIAGGTFYVTGAQYIGFAVARWDGVKWNSMKNGMSDHPQYVNSYPGVYALTVLPNGDLIAGGEFVAAGGVSLTNIARWNGSAWTQFGGNIDGPVHALAVLPSGDLVAGGSFGTAGGKFMNDIARWDGTTWNAIGDSRFMSDIRCIYATPAGNLLTAGWFNSVGTVTATNVARWNGTSWSSFGTGTNNGVNGPANVVAALPSGDVIVGGNFTMAGTKAASNFARWSSSGIPWIAVQPIPLAREGGETAVFTAKPASGMTGITYQWRRNGTPFNLSDSHIKVVSNLSQSTLTITGLSSLYAGNISVVATTSCGSSESAAVPLYVYACRYDLTPNGIIDDADFVLFAAAYDIFECDDPHMPPACSADFNRDSFVDDADFALFATAYDHYFCG